MALRILIVNDDQAEAQAHAQIIATDGFEPVVVHTTADAKALLETDESLRVVFARWHMPQEDGLSLCRWLRHVRPTRYTYFILLTARSGPESVIEGLVSGVDEFLVRPVAPLELLLRLRSGERVLALETRDTLIFALAKLAESRDPETGMHLERVQRYCHLLGEDLLANNPLNGIDREFVTLLAVTSALHDIGKVGIPDGVLLKPERLTPQETEVMRTHTTIGFDTLDAVMRRSEGARFLQVASEIARSHHEHWDGAGYPDGLRGTEIPLAARIMAVADVYDALTSRRVYKPPMPHHEAAGVIRDSAGAQFDPDVVAAFERCEELFDAARRELQTSPGAQR